MQNTQRRTTISIRVNDYERDLVTRAAATRHLRVGEYLRLLAREACNAGPLDRQQTADAEPGASS